MRRPALPIALLFPLLLVLAGCSGFTDQPTSTPDQVTTPAPVPTDGTGDGGRLAPGLASDGVTNATRLGEAHGRALANRSFTETTRSVSRFHNGTVYRELLVTTAVDADGDYLVVGEQTRLSDRPDDVTRFVVWGNDSHHVRRMIRDDGSNETMVFGGRNTYELGHVGRRLAGLLQQVDATVAGENTTDGRTEYLLTARRLTDTALPYGASLRQRGGHLRAVVTEAGFVRSVAGRATGTHVLTGEPAWTRFTVSYDGGGASVDRPDWVERVLANETTTRPRVVTTISTESGESRQDG